MLGLVAIVGVREVFAPAVQLRHDARVRNAVQSVGQDAHEVTE